MLPEDDRSPEDNRDRSVVSGVWAMLLEDRRLLVGAVLFGAAAILAYAVVRHLGIT
jgi:uncharacterized protein involved in exopolysaccharide biosynthesis